MESANLHHLQQDQLVGSSSLASCYGISTNTSAWTTPTSILNIGSDHNFNPNLNGFILNPIRDTVSTRQKNDHHHILTKPLSGSPNNIQDLEFHHPWPVNDIGESYTREQQQNHLESSGHVLHFPKIKEELSASSNPLLKFSSSTLLEAKDLQREHHQMISDHQNKLLEDSTRDLYYPNNAQNCSSFESIVAMAANTRNNFSGGQNVFPSINISNLNGGRHSPRSALSTSLEMNLEALDLLTTTRFSSCSSSHPSSHESTASFGPISSPKMAAFNNGAAEATKRSSTFLMDSKAPQPPEIANKKIRSESRSSCPPFKVRKEKLGDRISALQQLVAPFGKTDTASVLMDAIGYIKFLQNQVETLSVPYMKSTRNKSRSTYSYERSSEKDGTEEGIRRDLRSRGLCLMPLSCMSYMTSDSCGGQGVWSPQTLSFGSPGP